MTNNNFKIFGQTYIDKGLSVIPDKFGTKLPAIREWSSFCDTLATPEDITQWTTAFSTSNIALCLGEASGIIALDVDSIDQNILDLIVPLLPKSPVEKLGAKGFTRFFKFSGESTQQIKFNGMVVLELLSGGKKTTLPPSRHPSGVDYRWVSEKTLLDIKAADLPVFPPFLLSNIESKLKLHFKDTTSVERGTLVSGRNNDLSRVCGQLISDRVSLDTAIKKLIEYDKKNHPVPLFSDPEEMNSTDSITNAMVFYSNHLQTVNNKHYKRGEEYEIPVLTATEELSPMGKSQGLKSPQKNSSMDKPAHTVRETCPCCKGWKK